MQIKFLIVSLLYFLSTSEKVNGLRCYECAFVEGAFGIHSNPDCLDYPWSGRVPSEEGSVCLKAEGVIGGQFFVLRRAVRPAWIEGGVYPFFPSLQSSESRICDRDHRVGQNPNEGVPLMAIGNRPVDLITSCLLCNDHDHCNGAFSIQSVKLTLILSTLVALLLNYCSFQ